MDRDEIIAGIAEINAFCEAFGCNSDMAERWKTYTAEAIKLLNTANVVEKEK